MNQKIRDFVMRGDLDNTVLACRNDDSWWSQRDAQGKSFLHLAIENRSSDIAIWLATSGAILNQADNDGYTPLMLASLKGLYGVVSTLVHYGAKIDLREMSGQTALHKAVFSRNEPIIELLLESGADPNAEDKEGKRPLDLLFEVPSIAKLLRMKQAILGGFNMITPAA